MIELLDKIENQTVIARPIAPASMASIRISKTSGYDMQTLPTQMVEYGALNEGLTGKMTPTSSAKKIKMIHENLGSEPASPEPEDDNQQMEQKVIAGSNVAFTTPKNTDMKQIEVEKLKNNENGTTI